MQIKVTIDKNQIDEATGVVDFPILQVASVKLSRLFVGAEELPSGSYSAKGSVVEFHDKRFLRESAARGDNLTAFLDFSVPNSRLESIKPIIIALIAALGGALTSFIGIYPQIGPSVVCEESEGRTVCKTAKEKRNVCTSDFADLGKFGFRNYGVFPPKEDKFEWATVFSRDREDVTKIRQQELSEGNIWYILWEKNDLIEDRKRTITEISGPTKFQAGTPYEIALPKDVREKYIKSKAWIEVVAVWTKKDIVLRTQTRLADYGDLARVLARARYSRSCT